MTTNGRRRIKPALLQQDRDSFSALQAIAAYAPVNERYSLTVIQAAFKQLSASRSAEEQAAAQAARARETATAIEWDFHNLILGAKDQVVAQFGRDSSEAEAVGLKRKSEYKPRRRRVASNSS